jgi:hypothetical protein
MPNHFFVECTELSTNSYKAIHTEVGMVASFTYLDFWNGYETTINDLEELLAYVLPGDITCANVYWVNETTPVSRDKLSIQWSGEHYSRGDTQDFNLNLIMEETNIDKRVVCFPLFIIHRYGYDYWKTYRCVRPLEPKTHFCAFVVSNPTVHVRNTFFQYLSQYKAVASCGRAFNNINRRAPDDIGEYLKFLQQFKFMICFENNSKPYYLTEKLSNAWLGGTIPIYWGCTNAQKWLNPKAFLYLKDDSEQSMRELIQQIIELDNDDTKYMEMYNQPLLIGDIPDELNRDVIREHVRQVLTAPRRHP